MKNISSKILAYSLLLIVSTPVFAQAGGIEFSQILLSIAIILGLGAGIYVFFLGSQMSGSSISSALIHYGLGMLSVVVSLLSVTWAKPLLADVAGIAHDLFFIIGFILMVLGSRKVAGIL